MVPARWCGQWTRIFWNFFVLMTLMITCRMMIGSTKFRDCCSLFSQALRHLAIFKIAFLTRGGKSKKAQAEGVF